MRTAGYLRFPAVVVVAGTVAGLALLSAGCATLGRPQQFRNSFLPPPPHPVDSGAAPLIAPPDLGTGFYTNEAPFLTDTFSFVPPPRPTDTDFLLKQANDRFEEGKKALAEGRTDDARKEFNRAIDALLAAPDTATDRTRIERRLEELSDSIYRYDLDQMGAAEPTDQVSYDKAPMEGILDMTFPVDPSLRSKVAEQIHATTSQLPLDATDDSVIGAINFFSSERGRKIIAAGLRRQGRYKSMIERVLTEEGLPQELIFVAQEESGFLPRALSNKACVGMWQFAKFRGKEYGLDQTPATDDRMDPEKATRAAAHHLHDLYDHFGDWYLAIAAYDCGPGCIDHAVMRTGYADYWKLRKLNVLPKETANYVPVILAMTIIAKNARDYGLDQIDIDAPLEYESIELRSATHLALVADAVGRPMSEIKDLNPAVLRSVAPAGYRLHVPKGSLDQLEAAFQVVPAERRDSWRLHRVESGDTFAGLAKRYNASAAALVSSANHGEMPAEGDWMAIPVAYPGDRVPKAVKASPSTKKSRGRKSVTVAHSSTNLKPAGLKPAATKAAPKPVAKSAARPVTKSTRKPASKTAVHRRSSKSSTHAG
jgi:membrane-bound lytic murein transglycosylase D